MTQACVFLSLLKCWRYLAREQLCAEPTGRWGDPGAIFAYWSSGCSKVSVLPSVSEQQGPGLETAVAYNTYAISLLSQSRDPSTTHKPHQAPGKWVAALVCHKPCPKYGKRTSSQANLKQLHRHTHIRCCLVLALFLQVLPCHERECPQALTHMYLQDCFPATAYIQLSPEKSYSDIFTHAHT